MWNGQFSSIKAVQHRVVFKETNWWHIHLASYRAETKAREADKQEMDWMLAKNVIEPFETELALLIVFISRGDSRLLFCVNIRNLDAVKVWDPYHILHMRWCIDVLGNKTIFSTMNTNSRYRQVDMAEEGCDKKETTCHYNDFCSKRI